MLAYANDKLVKKIYFFKYIFLDYISFYINSEYMKNLICLKDLTQEEIFSILQLTDLIKKTKPQVLKGKTIGLLFEKPSCRTRVSFEVGIYQLGGNSIYLSSSEIQLKSRESISDVSRTLSRYLDGIILRTFSHQDIIEFARYSSISVINGLSDFCHPCQILSDLYTISKLKGNLNKIKIAYIGDGNNVCHSWLFASVILGLNLSVATPDNYKPNQEILNFAKQKIIKNPIEAVKDSDVIYTDVWTSMGQEQEKEIRKTHFKGFQINKKLVSYAKKDAIIMHCLPAHRGEEITNEIIESKNSKVFEQAENRLHTQKAILTWVFNNKENR